MPDNNHKHVEGHRRRKTLSVKQPRLSKTHPFNKPNFHELRKNEDGTYHIPTVVNGVTDVNFNTKIEPKYSDSIGILKNNLREAINVHNKVKCSLLKKQRIVLIGDSHIKGHLCNLKAPPK